MPKNVIQYPYIFIECDEAGVNVKKSDDVESEVKKFDSRTVITAREVLSGESKKNWFQQILPFMGPAFIASVAYMDPGNFATNIQGGAKLGLELLWVIVASNLMAILLQSLSAKLGIASGKDLAEHCRDQYPKWVVYVMWAVAELVAIATDLAEFLGAALGFYLLFGMPLLWAGVVTAIITFLILGLEKYGFRPIEAVITAIIGVVGLSYLIEIFLVKPNWPQVVYHAFVPQFSSVESIFLATGILGATVMPHAIYLHSSLTKDRIVVKNPKMLQKLYRFELIDVVVAMGGASFVNMAMLIMSAATFHSSGMTNIGSIEEAHRTLEPLLGHASQFIFGISLLASGLSSSSVGTMAGQVIMQGFLHKHVAPWLRRLVTILPSILVIALGLDPTRTLVFSQVVLSFGLPFAIIPLVQFTSNKSIMGVLVNKRITTLLTYGVAALIISLNFYLVIQVFIGS